MLFFLHQQTEYPMPPINVFIFYQMLPFKYVKWNLLKIFCLKFFVHPYIDLHNHSCIKKKELISNSEDLMNMM